MSNIEVGNTDEPTRPSEIGVARNRTRETVHVRFDRPFDHIDLTPEEAGNLAFKLLQVGLAIARDRRIVIPNLQQIRDVLN